MAVSILLGVIGMIGILSALGFGLARTGNPHALTFLRWLYAAVSLEPDKHQVGTTKDLWEVFLTDVSGCHVWNRRIVLQRLQDADGVWYRIQCISVMGLVRFEYLVRNIEQRRAAENERWYGYDLENAVEFRRSRSRIPMREWKLVKRICQKLETTCQQEEHSSTALAA